MYIHIITILTVKFLINNYTFSYFSHFRGANFDASSYISRFLKQVTEKQTQHISNMNEVYKYVVRI